MSVCCYVPYTLTLKAPAILTALGGNPNSSSSLPFIPGSALRGAVAKALGDPGADDSRKQAFHDLVLGGKARYLNAYPSADGRRALPVPVSFRRKKDALERDGSAAAVDLAAYAGQPSTEEAQSECWPFEQLEPLDAGFLTIGEAQPKLVQPKMSARMHHQRDRKIGRAYKDKHGNTQGAIFAFESLDAGQSFQGMIQVNAETQKECSKIMVRLKYMLAGPILFGRSRRAGYGGWATIQWGDSIDREIDGSGKEGLRPVIGDIAKDTQFRLLATSPCIVRNPETGQADPAALVHVLGRLLGDRAMLIRKRWSFEPVGGFNQKWRLALVQVLAVSAGSVFVFKAKQNIPVADLYRIENEGLGERKTEGYGRALFLDAPLIKISLHRLKESAPISVCTDRPPKLVEDIESAILNDQLIKKIEETALQFVRSAKNPPSNSLIGRLRTPLRGKTKTAIHTLDSWMRSEKDTEKLKRPAMEQLNRCRMDGGKTLADWIVAVLEGKTILDWLKVDALVQAFHIFSKESARDAVRDKSEELSIKMIDAVLAGLAVRNKTKEIGDEQ